MQISWHGLSCFEIVTKTSQGEVTVVVDPYDNETGLRFPRTLEANVVLVSHDDEDANNVSGIAGKPFVIRMPGEYEVKDVFVFGVAAPTSTGTENLMFHIESEDMHIAHLGALDRVLTDEELEQLKSIDILMVPVGGGRVMTPKVAAEVIAQIEPRVVIPMTHGIPNMKEKLESVQEFCKAMGVCRKEESAKYKVTRKELPEDEMLIMTLSR